MQSITSKKEFVQHLFQKGIVLERQLLDSIKEQDIEDIMHYIEQRGLSSFTVFDYTSMKKIGKNYFARNNISLTVEVMKEYRDKNVKKTVKDFVSYYHQRYKFMKHILQNREGLGTIASINKMFKMKDVDELSIIGMVKNIYITKNGHKMLELEDISGHTKVLLNKNKEDVMTVGKQLILDEIIAVRGRLGENIMFANKIFFPDIPMNKEFKKGPDEVYAAVISDLHIGSLSFLDNVFEQFIRWICCEAGSDKQKYVAERTGYVFIVGDLVAGVGNYPGQENNLKIMDVKDQFDKVVYYLKQIPSHIKIIICAGNHDPVRLAEPQPKFPRKYAEA